MLLPTLTKGEDSAVIDGNATLVQELFSVCGPLKKHGVVYEARRYQSLFPLGLLLAHHLS